MERQVEEMRRKRNRKRRTFKEKHEIPLTNRKSWMKFVQMCQQGGADAEEISLWFVFYFVSRFFSQDYF